MMGSYSLLKQFSLFAIFFIMLSPFSRADLRCDSLFKEARSPQEYIRKVPGDFLSFMRSNPAWSWAWFEANLSARSAPFKGLSQHRGVVGGDIKPDNVDIVPLKGDKAQMGIIDVDDGGSGRILGDLFHTLSYNKIWPLSLPRRELLDLYEMGLKSEKAQQIENSFQEILAKANSGKKKNPQKKLEKMAKDESYFLKELKLIPLSEATSAHKKVFAESSSIILKSVREEGDLIFSGLRVKESGGSSGLPRFTFLVKAKSGYKVIEAKMQSEPAVGAADSSQLTADKRISELIQNYRPKSDKGNIKEVVETPSGFFLMREKASPAFDGGKIPEEAQAKALYDDYVRGMFWWLGSVHGQQNAAFVSNWLKSRHQIESELFMLVDSHVEQSKKIFDSYQNP